MRVFCAEIGSGLGTGQCVRKPREMKIPNVVLAPEQVRSGTGREGRRPHCGPGKVDPHTQGSTLGAAALYSLPGAADLRGLLDQADSCDAE